ncbi:MULTISPECIES: alpha/beta hydrolase [unclassified Amycolatopsis]|uniref:alpha/beta hydrolase n=1 Tax=unclassified Amycolatopsis TaxID=2618356 RepID=UPI002875BF5C|nr:MULTISPECIES: alpha/beta hydrolase [unclassified Amycolatopsis]MDS0134551.1 alpha/beta hydrolase [Amycolatopsis sp. 505]MDS0147899.1 alpha/beta hydrolase [Amycolatopsis sp. CM201R]
MKLAEIAPELRPRADRLPRVPLEEAGVLPRIRAATAQIQPVEVAGVDVESTPGWRVHRPRAARPGRTLLWIHGGGFVVGRAAQDDRLCGETARELGITVVSVEYRLAPDAPYPAALDDCHAAWTWARDQAGGPDGVVVGGQSAGGALAAALVQRLCDRGERPHAQWLLCPMLDDRTAARRELDDHNHRGWDNRLNRFGWRSYLGTEPGAPDVPSYAVPARREDLAGLPPAWIGVGDIDLLHDESAAYARRLREAGVDATLHVVPGAPHGFEAWAPDTAVTRDYLATARAWLGDRTPTP